MLGAMTAVVLNMLVLFLRYGVDRPDIARCRAASGAGAGAGGY
jgi:hypothetical protein